MIATPSMIDVPGTQKTLERLANDLDKSGDAIAATRLRKLNAAVGGEPAASPEDWAVNDIQKIIDPDAIVVGIKGRAVPSKWVRWCELARNSFVLLPLIITWLGIWQATSAYDTLLRTNASLNDQPFLYLWEQGFSGNLWPPFILSNLALADFSLLALIFGLTVVVTWRYNLLHTQAEKDAEELREKLSHALGDASLCLTMARRIHNLQQPSDLADVARYLYQFGQQFQQTAQQFITEMEQERKQRGDLSAFTASLEKITKDLVAATTSMNQVNGELTTTVREVLVAVRNVPQLVTAADQAVKQLTGMVSSLGVLVTDQQRWRQELQDVLAKGLGQLITGQQNATQEFRTMLDGAFRQIVNILGQQITDQKNAEQEYRTLLNGLLTQLLNQQQKQGQALENMLVFKLNEITNQINTSLGALAAEQQAMGQRILAAADTLEDATDDLNKATVGLESATKEEMKLLSAVLGQQTAQKELTDQMTFVAGEIRNILKSVRESGPELRSMSVDIANFLAALRGMPGVLRIEMFEPIKHYSSAAASIASGSHTLEVAASHLASAANKLDGRLGP